MGLGDIHISYQYYWLTSWDVYLHIYSSFFQNWIVKNHCMQINTSYQNFSLENIQKIVVLLYNTTAIFLASAELVKSAYLEGNVPQHNKKKNSRPSVFSLTDNNNPANITHHNI